MNRLQSSIKNPSTKYADTNWIGYPVNFSHANSFLLAVEVKSQKIEGCSANTTQSWLNINAMNTRGNEFNSFFYPIV